VQFAARELPYLSSRTYEFLCAFFAPPSPVLVPLCMSGNDFVFSVSDSVCPTASGDAAGLKNKGYLGSFSDDQVETSGPIIAVLAPR
jgi:hypothetical protein